VAGSCEHNYEPSVSIKGISSPDDYQFLNKDSAPWSSLVN
jgi:hypothetical protein